MRKIVFIYVFLFLFVVDANAQGEMNNQDKIFYRNESCISALLLDNGFGLGYIYAKKIDFFKKSLYEINFINIRHKKEIKVTNPYYGSGKSFVFGKKNLPLDIRFGLGKQNKLYKKNDLGSIEIEYFYTYGVSLILLKPIYYDVMTPLDPYTMKVTEEKFSSSVHSTIDIYGKSSFYKGFSEIQFVPGAYVKLGMSFEFSQKEDIIHALDAGVGMSVYAKDVEIMANIDNPQLFFNLFISYRFGKAIDIQQKKIEKLSD